MISMDLNIVCTINKGDLKMKKILRTLLVSIVAIGLLGACTSSNASEEEIVVVIEHSLGTTEITSKIERVAIFDIGMLDTFDQLELDVEIAIPSNGIPSYLTSYVDNTTVGTLHEPDFEALFDFQPDLIIISGRSEAYYEELTKVSPTWFAKVDTKNMYEEFKVNVETIGKIFHEETKVQSELTSLDAQKAEIVSITKGLTEEALIVLTNNGKMSAYGTGSRFGFLHDDLQITPVDKTIDVSTHGQEIGYEYILKANPDYLFIVDRTQIAGGDISSNDTINNEFVKQTTAFQNDKVIFLNPETWYVAGAGLQSFSMMMSEVLEAVK